MAEASPAQPDIVAPSLDHLADGLPGDLVAKEYHEGLRFTGLDLTGRDLSGATFDGCEFDGLEADDAKLKAVRLLDSRFTKVTAPSLDVSRSGLRDTELTASRLGAVEMFESELRSVRFARSRLIWLNLRSAKLTDVLFEDCIFDEVDFAQVTGQRVAFRNCTATMARFDRAKLADVDLRGLDFTGISGLDGLRGATVSAFQATMLNDVFLDHFGISVTG